MDNSSLSEEAPNTTVEVEDYLEEEAVAKKREAFGNRHLTDEKNVFQYNAW